MNTRLTPPVPAGTRRRLGFEARGLVQGVGFRPHVMRTAQALGLDGSVCNHGEGVRIEVEGPRVGEFAERLRAGLPPLAHLTQLREEKLALRGERGFFIEESRGTDASNLPAAMVPADTAICADCLDELFDRGDRRYLHPFIACSDCGPRYTMTHRLPYDRINTAMADFPLCECCAGEYADPAGRRLHAEPIGCHDCGPRLSHGIAEIARMLADGGIVAVKGIGGYHLACDARNSDAIAELRRRKQRDARPFAVMMLNSESAACEIKLESEQRRVLEAPQRPIVIADRAEGFSLPDALAPGLGTLGVMLPYTALHYLLFHALEGFPEGMDWLEAGSPTALVMTSANRSGEPMITDDREAGAELGGIADLIVSHNRRIARGCDDSVVRASGDGRILLRRSRGFAPGAVALPGKLPSVLALGAHLKNTVCATRGDEAFLSAHHGDLDSAAMHRLLQRSSRDLTTWLGVEVEALACDLHPDYASTRLAERLAQELDVPLIRVQHHHAHIAAMLAARGHEGPALGLALDGHGFGADGGSWGGELLSVDEDGMQRLGHLRPLPLPGGDRAAREPWRIAVALAEQRRAFAELPESIRKKPAVDMLRHFAASDLCPTTTACGRYFDAAAALLGVCHEAGFEAEAPMRLEAECHSPRSGSDLYGINDGELDLHPLLMRLAELPSARSGSELFHGTLVDALTEWVCEAARVSGIRSIALGGGCFLNAVLARELPRRLRAEGIKVIAEWETVTPGDGSISLGQAWIAAHTLNLDKEKPGVRA